MAALQTTFCGGGASPRLSAPLRERLRARNRTVVGVARMNGRRDGHLLDTERRRSADAASTTQAAAVAAQAVGRRRAHAAQFFWSVTALTGGVCFNAEAVMALDSTPRREYESTGMEFIRALRSALQGERDGDDEITVRRKGDNVKAQIQRLIARGKERDGRTEQDSYQLLTTIMRDLGQFYSKNGPRARLEDGLREDILTRLEDAEQLLERHL